MREMIRQGRVCNACEAPDIRSAGRIDTELEVQKMSLTRRNFAALSALGLTSGALMGARADSAGHTGTIEAIAFDAFAIFDPRSVFKLAERLFPGRGAELSNEWRARQFEYTWLRVAARRYEDFWAVTADALAFAARKTGIELSPEQRDALMNAYLELKPWPDVAVALGTLKASGMRLAFLSNFTPEMLHRCLSSAGLQNSFEAALSTDGARTFKPDPRAYQLGIESLKLDREQILFVAFAGWDAAGAKAFGYPTYWLNRLKSPREELGHTPDAAGSDLAEMLGYLNRAASHHGL
jgi:2-haloacid dehalogenase